MVPVQTLSKRPEFRTLQNSSLRILRNPYVSLSFLLPQQFSLICIAHLSNLFFESPINQARELARDDLIRVLTGRSGDAVNWLENKFGLDLSKVARLGGHSQPRTHRGGAQFPGMVITYAQLERLEDLSVSDPDRVKILKKARVTNLIKDGDAVVGAEYEYEGQIHSAYGPVILATGGYAADFTSDSLLKKYRPELWNLPTTNGDHCTGDGQKMAMAIGAHGIDLEKVQVHPTGLVDPNEPDAKVKFLAAEALRGVGGLLLDNEGKRFVDELQHRDYVTGKMWENGKVNFLTFNEKNLKERTLTSLLFKSSRFVSFSTVKHPKKSSGIASIMSAVVS